MKKQLQNPEDFLSGDKVRIHSGPHIGARGMIQTVSNGVLEVQLDENNIVSVASNEVTNHSLAARRAWRNMPKRAGRPQLPTPRKKMVSMRLDIDLWDRLGDAVELGFINSREEAVNFWIREKLDALSIKPQDSDV